MAGNDRDGGADPDTTGLELTSVNIPVDVVQKWQTIVDTMAEVTGVPAGLIMRIAGDEIEVFVSSRTPGNPYHVGDAEHFFGSGLYCERVIAQRSVLGVPNALSDPAWRNNPDVRLGMVSYLGFPIFWPNAEPFGTICVLDGRDNAHSDRHRRLIEHLRDLVQHHLALIYDDAMRQLDSVTRQWRDQEAIRVSEERFATVFRLAPVPMAIAGPKGFQLLSVNEAFLAATGYDAEESLGRDAEQLDLLKGPAGHVLMTQALKGMVNIRNLEVQIRTKAGGLIDCIVSAEKIMLGDQSCVLAVFQDITERKRTETDLVAAIEAVMRDTSWFNSSVMEKLAQIRRQPDAVTRRGTLSDLTSRELEVLGLLSEGKADDAIADLLHLSRNTVRNHLSTIYAKLGVHRRSEAIIWARERGVLGYAPPKKRRHPRRPD